MSVRITRRATLVDAVGEAARWWWRYWERYMAAGSGQRAWAMAPASPEFDAEHAEDAEHADEAAHAGEWEYDSASVRDAPAVERQVAEPAVSEADRITQTRFRGVRRVSPASLILGALPSDEYAPRRVRRIETAAAVSESSSGAPKEPCP